MPPASPPAVLDLIGTTPLIEVTRIDTGPCRLFLKLESQNPGGSIKDRVGRSIIETAERDGRLKSGGTIVEATAGNTGLGLALVALAKGYLSKFYNDQWMFDQGFLRRERYGDLRDIISRRFEHGEVIKAAPDDLLSTVFQRMRYADVSQLPVIDGNRIVGLIDESDVLLRVQENNENFTLRADAVMTSALETLRPDAGLDALRNVLERGLVAIIADDTAFYGLITRFDLINYLRRTIT